jgi:hypothetical protein
VHALENCGNKDTVETLTPPPSNNQNTGMARDTAGRRGKMGNGVDTGHWKMTSPGKKMTHKKNEMVVICYKVLEK